MFILARSEFGPLAVEAHLEKVDIGVFVFLSSGGGVEVICGLGTFLVEGRELIIFCHFLR